MRLERKMRDTKCMHAIYNVISKHKNTYLRMLLFLTVLFFDKFELHYLMIFKDWE